MIHRYKVLRADGKFSVFDKREGKRLTCVFNTRWEAEHTAKGLNRTSEAFDKYYTETGREIEHRL